MIQSWQNWLLDKFIGLLERRFYNTPVKYALDDKRKELMFLTLWNIPGFREYCIERETRIVYSIANEADPEKQKHYRGQRVENMLWFTRAQQAFKNKQESFGKGADGSSPKR